jgi:flavin reductase (DIM6/NTAB) family NADH-FMN oxidoreductase RutF
MTSPYISESIVESAVGLVLTESDGRRNAMTVSFFSEVAHHPTALWVSIARASYTHALVEESGRFTLAVLNQRQGAIALACGTASGRDVDKCARLDLYPGPENYWYLGGALASTAARVRQAVPVGDHTLFVADILASDLESRSSHLRHLLLSDLQG